MTREDVERVAEALDDADGWVRTKEAWEAAALLRSMIDEVERLRKLLGISESGD